MKHPHIDREYDNELKELRQEIMVMAGEVKKMIARAVQSFISMDTSLANGVTALEYRVNQYEMDIDERCLSILARRQPMASDLRFITLGLKMVTDLERIGDEAVNICERVIDIGSHSLANFYPLISQMAEIAQSMIHDAITAFIEKDAKLAKKVVTRDDEVDALYVEVINKLVDYMVKENVKQGFNALSIAKVLERMADHGTNIAEQVIFMVKGKDIRHSGESS
ncbi:MAG: phosphate transport system regulatory protein PhoU [Spirochaeta sp. LUC14_002_19_P3]|nr:MAG: phosphate transport system regulatory protein PhoU [Spirochaeta sp. LUC14_002_19_P3]